MSHNWDQTGGQDFLNSLLTDFQLCTDNTQGSSLDPVPEALFDSNNNHDHLIDPGLAAWSWAGEPNPPSSQAGQNSTQTSASVAEQNDKRIISELVENSRGLDSRLESRIAQFEEKVNTLQNRLEEKAKSFCDEIDAQGSPPWFFFPIGSVPTRSMIAFLRDLDPAGRSEPEGMESTAPSTNDVDVLSSATLAVASLATPAPSLREETPHEEVEHQYLWRCFPDYVWSQRVRDTPSWVWGFGYDVEDSSGSRRWVCRRCIQNKNPKPRSFAEKGIQNANAHLFKGHGIRAPPDKTKSAAEKKAEKLKAKDQRSIAEVMKLDTRLPREQDIANSLAKGFDRKHFQRLLLEWIIEENHAFSVCEQGRLRQIFEYLNPLVKITDANITRTTIRRKVLSAYEMHKDKVIAALKQSCGLIHVSFDGWKSGNRHSLYGIACFFRDENSQPRKLTLGVPELRTRHFGHNIAAEILDVLDAYGIQDKIGYFTLDNAESNDKAMEIIGGELGFVGSTRRGRCFGHTLNLSAKALLFGHNVEAFEEQLSGEAALSEAEHTLWRRKGPVGKLHNLVVDVRRSDQLTYLLRSIQRSEFDLSSDPRIRARQPVDLIIDNDTRWLSQLYMIRRAIILRLFIEQLVLKHRQQWEQDNRSKRTGNLRKSAREPRICLEEN
ncbi:hypothetical protein MRS44_013840 [Fusarium solani]|uniref:uncharacterized protein n=1 Tax=Fusarium solani TaxID=169388 RepID=UPI0032C3D63C|nr:hypothetical protein MRS44_013840 [Fusarium solani]